MTPQLCRTGLVALLVLFAMDRSVRAQAPASSVPPSDPRTLAVVEGVALGMSRQPLAEAGVIIMSVSPNAGGSNQAYQATSDAQGRFSIAGVEPGKYNVVATHAGYEPYDTDFYRITGPPPPGVARSASLTIFAGQHLANLEIQMVPLTVLSGKVTDENGDPMAGVTIRPMQGDMVLNGRRRFMHRGASVQTDAEGKYQLSVYSGRWYLSYQAKASPANAGETKSDATELGYVPTYFPGLRDINMASAIDASGVPLPGLNVRLDKVPVYHARGKLTGLPGQVSPDLRIVPWHEGGSGHPSVVDEGQRVASDGTFDVVGLTPGAWTLIVCQYGKPDTFGRLDVRVTDEDLHDVAIAFHPPGELSGTFAIIPDQPDSKPIRPLTLRLTPVDPLLSSTDTPIAAVKNGESFTLKNVEAGRYRVDLIPPSGGYVKSVNLGGQEYIDSGIDLRNGSSGNLHVVVSMTAGEIAGNVTTSGGAAPSAAIITLAPDGPSGALYRQDLRLLTRTDPTGHFSIRSVVPGTYRVYAWERLDSLDVFPDPEFPRLFDSQSALVTVAENESKQVSLTVIPVAKMEAELRGRY